MNGPVNIFVALAWLDWKAGTPLVACSCPTMLTAPTVTLLTAPPTAPDAQEPVMLIVPDELFTTVMFAALPLLAPVTEPVMLIVPVELFATVYRAAPVAPWDKFPVIFTVPVESLLTTPLYVGPSLHTTFATIVQALPIPREETNNLDEEVPPTNPLPGHVNVIPFVGTNNPPAVTPVAEPLLILSTVGDVSIVTVNVLL